MNLFDMLHRIVLYMVCIGVAVAGVCYVWDWEYHHPGDDYCAERSLFYSTPRTENEHFPDFGTWTYQKEKHQLEVERSIGDRINNIDWDFWGETRCDVDSKDRASN